jgi:hypothetical protein
MSNGPYKIQEIYLLTLNIFNAALRMSKKHTKGGNISLKITNSFFSLFSFKFRLNY